MKLAIMIVAAGLLVSCGPGARQFSWMSSGHVGCSPSEIEISEEQKQQGIAAWVATCNGQRYYCSAVDGSVACTAATTEAVRTKLETSELSGR